jgi:hypothetical protein
MILKIPVYYQLEGFKGTVAEQETMKDLLQGKLYHDIERSSMSSIRLSGGIFSSDPTVDATFKTPSDVHEILRTKS